MLEYTANDEENKCILQKLKVHMYRHTHTHTHTCADEVKSAIAISCDGIDRVCFTQFLDKFLFNVNRTEGRA
jgi:hypothetical protein